MLCENATMDVLQSIGYRGVPSKETFYIHGIKLFGMYYKTQYHTNVHTIIFLRHSFHIITRFSINNQAFKCLSDH